MTADGSYHHGNLRAALLERAEAVLTASGAEGLSLRGLARDLGVSHAAPSRHFRDRQALLDALAVSGFTTLNARLRSAAAGGTDGADGADEAAGPVGARLVGARLAGLGRAYVDFAVGHTALLDLMFTVKHADDSSAELRELGHESLLIVARLMEEGQRTGAVRPGDPVQLAQVAFSTVHGLATLAVAALLDDTPLSEAMELALEVLLAGLRPGR
ncbi:MULTISPECIES: TetR/AcrR family transcriptional regulator [Streptomyces]|uniref:TetR/AcrR family transcriptional regulator n=1 Tax=Streptomyces TaxID=1883 RepID=UPI000F552F9E|nr:MULTISPECIES: TetR/AcrR family transcriptional regulator [Streptomyces]RPK32841.1 Transcriptional regulator, TetR family [Streptomyces sp. ADI91-18]WSS02604.1 TetR/AcrR family transcriptional regulator [Streptomyces goshikiensis]